MKKLLNIALQHVQLLGSGQKTEYSNAEMCTLIGEGINQLEENTDLHHKLTKAFCQSLYAFDNTINIGNLGIESMRYRRNSAIAKFNNDAFFNQKVYTITAQAIKIFKEHLKL